MNALDVLPLAGVVVGAAVCLLGARRQAALRRGEAAPQVTWNPWTELALTLIFTFAGEAFASFFLRSGSLAVAVGAVMGVMSLAGSLNRLQVRQRAGEDSPEVRAHVRGSYLIFCVGLALLVFPCLLWQWLRFSTTP